MKWEIIYHKDVVSDLESVGPFNARRIMKAIDSKFTKNPIDFGKPLSGNLVDFQKLRVGDFRIVYQTQRTKVVVFVLAVGPRRDKEIYKAALKRI
jgi:mRNA interferase RelE/StbE